MEGARKIELQAPEDLAYLVANVRRAAAARIDEAFPPVEDSGEDPLRMRIEKLVDEYITKTFTLAAPNLSINGLPLNAAHLIASSSKFSSASHPPPTEPEEVFEPFDARKRARVEALTAEQEDLLRDIAALKKSIPGSVAGNWAEGAKKGVKEDEESLEKANAAALEGGDGGEKMDVKPLERQEDVEEGFGEAVRGLGRLKREMPAVVARMERARKAGEYVVTER